MIQQVNAPLIMTYMHLLCNELSRNSVVLEKAYLWDHVWNHVH
jgi:hypothetical protein